MINFNEDIPKFNNYFYKWAIDSLKMHKSLEHLYNKLADLEINNKENTQEYKDILNYIKFTNEIIDKKLNDEHIEPQDAYNYKNFLLHLNNSHSCDFLESICNLSEINYIKRFYNELYKISLKDEDMIDLNTPLDLDSAIKNAIIDELGEDIYQDDTDVYLDNDDDTEEVELLDDIDYDEFKYLLDNITDTKDNLIYNLFYDYLDEYINKEKDEYIKNNLIKVKYRLIYLSKDLEDSLINNGKVKTRTNIYKEILIKQESIYQHKYDELFIEPLIDEINNNVNEIINHDKNYYKDKNNIIKNILLIILTKVNLSLNYDPVFKTQMNDFKKDLIKEAKCKESIESIKDSFNLTKSISI